MHLLGGPLRLWSNTRTARFVVCSVGKASHHRIRSRFDYIQDKLIELDLGNRNSMSNVRSGGKAFGRCMANCFRCTGDMPTEHDPHPVYGPLCGTRGRLCAHTGVERRESLTSLVAKPIETTWFGIGADLGSGADRARAMKTSMVTLRSAFVNWMGLVSTMEKREILKDGV